MKYIILLLSTAAFPLAGCSYETKPTTYEVGELCFESGRSLNECSLICEKMGTAKDDCFGAYLRAEASKNKEGS